MREIRPYMFWVGSLQDIGKNYTDLYFDKEEQRLYLLIRLNDTTEQSQYAVMAVVPEQVKEYMDGTKVIGDIFSNCPYKIAEIHDKQVGLVDGEMISYPGIFKYNQPFDSEMSRNRSNINLVIKRLMKGRMI